MERYVIADLTPGWRYFVRVLAVSTHTISGGANEFLKSPASSQSSTSSAIPAAAPGAVTSATLSTDTTTSLRLQYAPPDSTKREGSNGKKVTSYAVELGARVFEQQLVTVKATGSSAMESAAASAPPMSGPATGTQEYAQSEVPLPLMGRMA